jgi:molybdenum cofactor cytidylyltransferase
LREALELRDVLRADTNIRLAIVGAGGKTTAMMQLARQLKPPVLITATAHLSLDQAALADQHFIINPSSDLLDIERNISSDVCLFTGPAGQDNRTSGLDAINLTRLKKIADHHHLPLLIEADGSRRHPLKAPADYEPAIPAWVNHVAVVQGLSGLHQPLTEDLVHRSKRFVELIQADIGAEITVEMLKQFLVHPFGGLKNIPSGARKTVVLNQADSALLQAEAKRIVPDLLNFYDSVIISSLGLGLQHTPYKGTVHAVFEPIAGIILAAGGSQRMGRPKALLLWKGMPFVYLVAKTALYAGLKPVVVVTGEYHHEISEGLADLPVTIVKNPEWKTGQSSSIKAGLAELNANIGGTIFLLCDQPQIPATLLITLVEIHRQTLSAVVSPQVEGKRANPVLFDRTTFPDLNSLQGDMGGRGILGRHPISWLEWNDFSITYDIDSPSDYERLLELE